MPSWLPKLLRRIHEFTRLEAPSRHQQPVFNGANVPVVWGTLAGASHNAATGNAGGLRGPVTAWFRAHLMDDASAAQVFPPICTLCTTPGWSVVTK